MPPSSSATASSLHQLSEALRTRPVYFCDTKVSEVCFFLRPPHSALVAAPLDLQQRQDASWAHSTAWRDGSLDLDFALYDDTVTSADASTATAADRNPRVDYSVLSAAPMPARSPGETIKARADALHAWIERCYQVSASTDLGPRLRKISARLSFEYESYLSSLKLPDNRRCVQGVVAAGSSGQANHSVVALAIPLLISQQAAVVSTLDNILTLYAKFTGLTFRKPQHITSVLVDLCIQLRIHGPPSDDRMTVQSERLSVHVEDGSASGREPSKLLLQSFVNLNSLPQFSTTLQRREGFMEYIPKLEETVYHCLRQPYHFLSLILGLSATFGNPIDLCPTAAPIDSAAQSVSKLPLVRTAAFCVVDRRTQASFMIGLHYYTGLELPSVGVVANQYASTTGRASPLRAKVRYSDGTAESLPTDKDGFLQVEEVSRAVASGVMEALSKLMASFSS